MKNQRGITADKALGLAQYFGNTPQFWMNLQQNYELARVKRAKWFEIQLKVRQRAA